MARSEARIYTDIWGDGDFLNLQVGEQRAFMFVLSQIDLAHDGVISLRVVRWARKAKGLTPQQLHKDLAGLAAAGFVVVDHETEELLVRSFIRRDKVYRQPNVLRAAADHLPLVESARIRAAMASEIDRVLTLDDVHKDSRPILVEMLRSLAGCEEPAGGNPKGNPSDNPSAGTPGVRGIGTAVTTDSPNPVPGLPEPHTPTPMSADALIPLASLTNLATADAATDSESTANTSTTGKARRKRKAAPVSPATAEEFAEAWDEWPRSDKKQAAAAAHQKARINVEQADLVAAIRSYVAYERARGTEDRFIPYLSTWLNQERWKDRMSRPDRTSNVIALRGDRDARPPMRSTTDDRVNGWLAIAAAAEARTQTGVEA